MAETCPSCRRRVATEEDVDSHFPTQGVCWRKLNRSPQAEVDCLRIQVEGLRGRRGLHADWLIDQLCRAAEIEFRGDARALLKARVEKALNPELPL